MTLLTTARLGSNGGRCGNKAGIALGLAFALAACGSSDGDGSDRGGPDSLIGFSWRADPVEVNGIEFRFGFEFSRTDVAATNTCNGAITAQAAAPVRYRYSATVSEGAQDQVEDGGNFCEVAIGTGSVDFEITDNKLIMQFGGETIEFQPKGAVAGLYGEWTASADFGILTWSMGGGEIRAAAECDNGLRAETSVDADFRNILDITQAAQDTVTDGGLECEVSIAAASVDYYFDGDTLVMSIEGQETRFEK